MMLGTVRPTRHRSAARVSRGLPARTSGRWDETIDGRADARTPGEDAHLRRCYVGSILKRRRARMAMNVTVDTLLDRVKDIAPMLRAYAAEAEAQRRLARPVVDAVSFLLNVSRDGCLCVVLTRM